MINIITIIMMIIMIIGATVRSLRGCQFRTHLGVQDRAFAVFVFVAISAGAVCQQEAGPYHVARL